MANQFHKDAEKLADETQELLKHGTISLRLLKELWMLMEKQRDTCIKKKLPIASRCNEILRLLSKDFYMMKRMVGLEQQLLGVNTGLSNDLRNFEDIIKRFMQEPSANETSALRSVLMRLQESGKKEQFYLVELNKCLQHLHRYLFAKALFPENSSEQKEWIKHALEYSKQVVEIVHTLREESPLPMKVQQSVNAYYQHVLSYATGRKAA